MTRLKIFRIKKKLNKCRRHTSRQPVYQISTWYLEIWLLNWIFLFPSTSLLLLFFFFFFSSCPAHRQMLCPDEDLYKPHRYNHKKECFADDRQYLIAYIFIYFQGQLRCHHNVPDRPSKPRQKDSRKDVGCPVKLTIVLKSGATGWENKQKKCNCILLITVEAFHNRW